MVHDVTLAGSAEEALARTAEERFSAILCDLRMPGMGGEALYRRLLHERPEQAAAFVFMTGVGDGRGVRGAEVERFLAASGRPVLRSPSPQRSRSPRSRGCSSGGCSPYAEPM